MEEIAEYNKRDKQLIFTAPATLPPLVTTLESQSVGLSLQDGGCVRPCHMRSTIYQVPTTQDLLDSSGLEFSVVVKPFDEGEVDGKIFIPLSMSQIERCNRCKAYINPFSASGECVICKHNLQVVQDRDQRPELQLGSYEFRVTPDYYRRVNDVPIPETRRPHLIFAIEMTANSQDMVRFLSENLANVLKNDLPTDFLYATSMTPLLGFVTYNSKVTVHDIKNGGHSYIISDPTSVTECASVSQFLVDPAKDFENLEKFIASLSDMCREQAEHGEQQTLLGPAIEAALKACYHDTSNYFETKDPKKGANRNVTPVGKIYILHSSLPTAGDDQTPGRLPPPSQRAIDDIKRQLGSDTESKALGPDGKYYTQLARKCYDEYASGVELFLFPPQPRAYLNIATIGELAKLTGTGVINKYHRISMNNFLQDLRLSLKSTMGFDASIRVRSSVGISSVRYIGNFKNNDDNKDTLEMSAVNSNSNFIVQFKYDDKLPDSSLVVIQMAMIYTSMCGERRVRVHNLALSTCASMQDLYKSACCDTLVNVLVRDTIEKMRTGNLAPKKAKEQLTARVVKILHAYRKHCASDNQAASPSQLILPEGLKLLPVYLCGALKCDAIDGGPEMFPDDKVLSQMSLLGALPSQSQVTIYPRMYSVEACEADDEENEYGLKAELTRCFNPLIKVEGRPTPMLELGQCYILENGYYLFIYIPNNDLARQFLASVFGELQDKPDLMWDDRRKDTTEEVKFLENLIEQIETERRKSLRISVVRQGDKLEPIFKTFLYEENKRPGLKDSYIDILCSLHHEIRSKFGGA